MAKDIFWSFRRYTLACGMYLATSNKADRLLFANYVGHITVEDLAGKLDFLKATATELGPGFRILVDFSNYESMDPECFKEIGKAMEMFVEAGLGMAVRIIPDSSKDPGMNILTAFHYKGDAPVVTCKNLKEAVQALQL